VRRTDDGLEFQHRLNRDGPLGDAVEILAVGIDRDVEILGVAYVAVEHHRDRAE
jgi:hypothetical protein